MLEKLSFVSPGKFASITQSMADVFPKIME